MSEYLFLIGPYFLGSVAIAFILVIVSIWWSRHPFLKAAALLALGALVWLNLTAVDNFYKLAQNNLSLPKPVTFKELQDMLPEGHPGHLVLYGEEKTGSGIYLLLRTPKFSEPRYYLMSADEKLQEQFKDAQKAAKEKNTQLLLGGKQRSGEKSGEAKREKGGFDRSPGTIFHPAPVSGGPEKNLQLQDQPISIPTPYSEPSY